VIHSQTLYTAGGMAAAAPAAMIKFRRFSLGTPESY
jgi:hypothetical protein